MKLSFQRNHRLEALIFWIQQRILPGITQTSLLWRIGYIFSVLVISLITGYLTVGFLKANSRFILVLGAIVGIIPLVYLIKNPHIGLIIFIPVSFFVPFSLGTGSESSVNVSMMLIILLVGVYVFDSFVLKRWKLEIPKSPILILFVFLIYAIFCFGFGQIRWYPIDPAPLRAQIGGLGIFVLSGCVYLLSAYLIDDLRALKWIVYTFIGLGAIIVIGLTLPNLSFLVRFLQNGTTGSLFWVWLVAISYSQGIFNTNISRSWRIGFIIIFIWTMTCSLSPTRIGWTSGWLPSILTIAIISFIAKPSRRPFIIGAISLALVFEIKPIINVIIGEGNAYSLSTRIAAWQILSRVIMANPILGLGFANYYWYVQLFPIMGYAVVFNSHNNYMDIVAQTGITGLFIFAWFMWKNWQLGWESLDLVQDGFSRAFVYGALGGLVGTLAAGMLGDWFLPFVYNVGFTGFRASMLGWLFLGCLVALYRINARKKSQV